MADIDWGRLRTALMTYRPHEPKDPERAKLLRTQGPSLIRLVVQRLIDYSQALRNVQYALGEAKNLETQLRKQLAKAEEERDAKYAEYTTALDALLDGYKHLNCILRLSLSRDNSHWIVQVLAVERPLWGRHPWDLREPNNIVLAEGRGEPLQKAIEACQFRAPKPVPPPLALGTEFRQTVLYQNFDPGAEVHATGFPDRREAHAMLRRIAELYDSDDPECHKEANGLLSLAAVHKGLHADEQNRVVEFYRKAMKTNDGPPQPGEAEFWRSSQAT